MGGGSISGGAVWAADWSSLGGSIHESRRGQADQDPRGLDSGLIHAQLPAALQDQSRAVSYTHLTLPTICSV
eukprot:1550357-Prymnesium_polylepis.1